MTDLTSARWHGLGDETPSASAHPTVNSQPSPTAHDAATFEILPPGPTDPAASTGHARRPGAPLVALAALGVIAIAAAATFVATRPSDEVAATPDRVPPATSPVVGDATPSPQPEQPVTRLVGPTDTSAPAPTQGSSGLVGTDAPASRSVTMLARATAPETSPDSIDSAYNPVGYDASQMLDGLAETCWRADGEGKGLVIDFDLPPSTTITGVGLINGYAKTDPTSGADRYAEERRILRVTWLIGGRAFPQVLQDGDRTIQPMSIDPTTTDQVRLVIDTTTPPGDPNYDTTAISEVELLGV